jgi:adenylyl-sulfate kinase
VNHNPNIFLPDASLVTLEAREARMGHRGKVVWMTGLSGSGKSTLARSLEKALWENGVQVCILDGDVLRSGLNSGLGFTDADRSENIRRAAEVARLMKNTGLVVLCCFVSPSASLRALAKNIIGEDAFLEVYVEASLATVKARDTKGLYARAAQGENLQLTGVQSGFEPPVRPDFVANTDHSTIASLTETMLQWLSPKIRA